MAVKQFKNLDEQIEILKSRGLIINNIDWAKEILLRENYFFLSGYRHVFLKSQTDKRYVEGVTFEELYALFTFDRHLRNIVFKNLLIIENNMKSIFSYQLSKKYGYKEKDYLKVSNFTQDRSKVRQVNDILKKMKRQIRVNGKQHTATLHYLSNYGYIPLWILVKVLSFGIVGELFLILKDDDMRSIAGMFDLDPDTLSIYLPILANYRNLCAHEDILFENRTNRMIVDTKYHLSLCIPLMDNEYIYGKDDMLALIIMFKQLLSRDEFNLMLSELTYELDILRGKIKSIPFGKIMDRMGLPESYSELKEME